MDEVSVRVLFTVEGDEGTFTDALYYSLDEYKDLDPKRLESEKAARYQEWLVAKDRPVVEVAPETEMLAVDEQLSQLTSRKAELQRLIAEKVVARGAGK